ncbi:MAG: L-erythro-3,5-diaminohexanoate dehydrogenase [Bacillota bacterium]
MERSLSFGASCKYGSHRSIDPPGSMPQSAWKIDNCVDIYPNELLLDVDIVNVNSTSFSQILIECGRNEKAIEQKILDIVQVRGKLHNPVTGSGGMLIGRIKKVGSALADRITVKEGVRIATLVSLTLTPLKLHAIKSINMDTGQIQVQGEAVLFESSVFTPLPDDLPTPLLLSAFDCAGAPAMTRRLVKKDDTVVVLGAGGRTGLLCSAVARDCLGPQGRLAALVRTDRSLEIVQSTNYFNAVIQEDATKPLKCTRKYEKLVGFPPADVVINCINEPGTEMTSILLARQKGTIFFANLSTSFTSAALSAEGVGKDVDMLIYHGYVDGHADLVIETIRKDNKLRELFVQISSQ